MFNINKTKSLLLALIVLVAGAGVAFAAAPSVDTSTTDTSQSSDITDNGTQSYNVTTTSNLSWVADSANSSVEITQNGTTLYEATPTNYSYNASGNNDYYYNVSLADDASDYSGNEVGAGENATLNVTFVNNTSASSPDKTNISYTFVNGEAHAFIGSENPETEESDDGFFTASTLAFWSDSNDSEVGPTVSTDSTTITNNTSTVQLDTMSSNLTDAYSTSTEDASDGDLLWSSYTQVSVDGDSRYLATFSESAADDTEWLNTSEDAYATISSDEETMTIHNADALLDDDQTSATLDVTAVGNEQLGRSSSASMYESYDAGTFKSTIGAFGASDFDGNPTIVEDALEA
ncbi:hypothetical protein [Halolamina sp.]|uniref:hypothetical protein n=1 Tax=Halolamina sp. TaxID=1940283 RepID=UPI003564A9C4